jgi:8-oxo-dGTP pyrophosphatase MutT (NUDIX family)
MDFQYFLEIVPDFITVALPGKVAQYKMVPFERIESMKKSNFDQKKPKNAAVLMLFYPKKGKTHLVLIVRNTYEGVHSAQIAFPGGKFELEDRIFENTALRETFEEIGIPAEKIEIIKAFTNIYIDPSNFMVYPFFGICTEELLFVPDPKEVAQIIELPLSMLLNEDIIIEAQIETSYSKSIAVPAFEIEGYVVWGATAMMLSELKDTFFKIIKP